jgi:tetratricopeptide (TPR) repeat protein
MGRKARGVAIVCAGLVLAVMSGIQVYYARTGAWLSDEGEAARRKWVKEIDNHEISGRAAIAGVREFILDYPDSDDPELRLAIATAAADQLDPNTELVAGEIERVASDILAASNPQRIADLKAFAPAGYEMNEIADFAGQNFHEWATSMILADIDGDGTPDLLLRFPARYSSSNCSLLFRHTSHGWVCHRLTMGANVYGMWVFDITPHGPRAIETQCLIGSEYDPIFLVNVSVWRGNRLTTVLSTTLKHGFQLDHRDLDGDGRQAIRLFGNTMPPNYGGKPNTMTVYRWDGIRYRLSNVRQLIAPKLASEWQNAGETLFERQHYTDAEHAYTSALAWKPAHGSAQSEDYAFDKNLTLWHLGLCRALRGDGTGAVAAMRQISKTDDRADYTSSASVFIAALGQGQSPAQALAASGQSFRMLESAARAARADSVPEAIFAAAGIRADRLQRLDLSGDGMISCLARLSWPDGSAVVALRPDGTGGHQHLHILAYGRTDVRPPDRTGGRRSPFDQPSLSTYRLPFYLPQAPAMQLYPAPTQVDLKSVRPGDGRRAPEITLDYVQNGVRREGIVRWNGEQFAMVSPLPPPSENFEMALDRIEAQVYVNRSYRTALSMFAQLEERIRTSDLNQKSKTDLLMEIFYHQAVCYRILGQRQHAAAIYAALQRTYSDTDWGKLAQHQLAASH